MLASLVALSLFAAPPSTDAVFDQADALYRELHKNPELSHKEVQTAARMAKHLRTIGFEVTTGVGGTGVVGVLKNGAGPTVLLRTDMDALPVEEKTGLSFASANKGVMHACGHDLHMAMWAGATSILAKDRQSWKGTLVAVAQPAEEKGEGARAMLKDGLLTRFPKPDYALALHDSAQLESTKVGVVSGFICANVDSVDITLFGEGGHGAYPHTTVDPIVMGARLVGALQTLVARENNPFDPAVVTVGSFHAGTKHNIIPEEARLQLTVRSYKPEVRQRLLSGIERLAQGEATAARAPKAPSVVVGESLGATWNDPALAQRLRGALEKQLGADAVVEGEKVMGAEDFGELARAGIPSLLLWLGATEPDRMASLKKQGKIPPSAHSPLFAPDKDRSLGLGIRAWVAMVHDLCPPR